MKRKVFSLALVLVLVASLFLVGCGGDTTDAPAPDNGEVSTEPIKIGGLTALSGVLQDYGEQMQRGFELGLEYMTDGTNEVAGREIQVIWEDTQTNPEVATDRARKLLEDDDVDILVGPTASGSGLAIMQLAEEYERVLVVEPAVADDITGPDSNRFVFRTGRNSTQDALAMAAVVLHNAPDGKIATFAPDTQFGRQGVEPFIEAIEASETGAEMVAEEYAPADATDFTPFITRIRNSGADYTFVIWAGENDPWRQFTQQGLNEHTQLVTGAPQLDALRNMLDLDGMQGFTVYYNEVAENPVNEWLVERHKEEHGSVPDIFTSGGMAAAMAIVTAIENTNGSVDAEDLIQEMRGMEFDSPTGMRYFRAEDHQAMQPLFEVDLEQREGYDHIVPTLRRVIPAEELEPPVRVTHD
ncbi:substrate-binding domain-containing protein [Serpentinicella sp. ANB-PHB4]|uniref:substrate-binding domain-containing protein n=1 Tax=Serpentinicella sp. ANB-PHB4 TaxID=3074076 RepID=UPI002859E006|nr:substrate-binding domain-containing protein [Serpentinicella sp. ANB-PHB4]MDR5658604.1 substrate-binding domain-containing protein [Serpentinicella sp. ANB-PHB4]